MGTWASSGCDALRFEVNYGEVEVRSLLRTDRRGFSGKLRTLPMETVFSVIAILVGVGVTYALVRLLWDDEMPNWIG